MKSVRAQSSELLDVLIARTVGRAEVSRWPSTSDALPRSGNQDPRPCVRVTWRAVDTLALPFFPPAGPSCPQPPSGTGQRDPQGGTLGGTQPSRVGTEPPALRDATWDFDVPSLLSLIHHAAAETPGGLVPSSAEQASGSCLQVCRGRGKGPWRQK